MKKLIIAFVIFILLLLLCSCGTVFAIRKIPSITGPFLKQVDLGVEETPEKIYGFYEEIGYENNLKGEEPKTGKLVFEGTLLMEHTFTQQEINSWIAAWEGEWAGLPVRNSQIRINKDGTVEASTTVSLDSVEAFAKSLGYSDTDISNAKSYLKVVPQTLPVYAKGKASIVNNTVDYDIQDIKIGQFPLPSNMYSPVESALEHITTQIKNLSQDTNIEKAVVTPDGVDYKGTVPAKVDIENMKSTN